MKVGCLLIHGFTGAPYEVLPLADYLQSQGVEVEVPTLTGHGGELRNLRGIKYEQWISDAEEAFNRLRPRCDRLIVIGFSMGGLLAVNLAYRYKIDGLITLSAPIFVWDVRQMGLNLITAIRIKEYKRIKKYLHLGSQTPFSAAVSFKKLLNKTKVLIPYITVPVLIVQGKKDDTVKAKSAAYIHRNIGSLSKQLHYLPESNHLVCCGPEKEVVLRLVNQFVKEVVG